jgi:hypothetical protein
MSDTNPERQAARTPPYVSWRTLRSLIQDLHGNGVPSRIDRSILTRFSGVVGTQLMTTLRFFDFIDNDGHPTDAFKALVKSQGTPAWEANLEKTIREHYAPLLAIDLASATPAHFSETFRKAFPGADSVQQKCATFFLYAARDAGIKVSDRVLKGRKPRTLMKKRVKVSSEKVAEPNDNKTGDLEKSKTPGAATTTHGTLTQELLKKFPEFDPTWPDPIKTEWFKAFERFMQMDKKEAPAGGPESAS